MSDTVMTKEEGFEMAKTITNLRELVEKYGIESSEYKNYAENADKRLEELDKKHDELVKSESEKENQIRELKERIKHMETNVALKNSRTQKDERKNVDLLMNAILKKQWVNFVDNEETCEYAKEYFEEMAEKTIKGLPDFPTEAKQFQRVVEEYKAKKAAPEILRSDISEMGGFLCSPVWSNELLRQIVEYSPVRQFARVKRISGKSMMQPIRQGVPRALYVGETIESQDSVSNYTSTEMKPHRLTHTVPVTWDELNDNAYNLSNEIMTDSRIAFAVAEGYNMVRGNGVERPLGFTADPDVPVFETGTSTLTVDDILLITGEMKSGYNPMLAMNRRTLAYLRTLKSNDSYLWTAPYGDISTGAPAMINGLKYSSAFVDMDDYDVNDGYPILLADFFNFYQIVDRTDMVIVRDEYTRKKEAIIEFTLMMWNHGMPVMKEAGILLKKKA